MESIMQNNARPVLSLRPIGTSKASSCHRACPRCNSAVFSVSRRLIDLLISIIVPVRRYRCISMKCSWEGNLRNNSLRLPSPSRSEVCRQSAVVIEHMQIRRPAEFEKSQG
jgi:hypothetical protein